jgi:hypothetical protein
MVFMKNFSSHKSITIELKDNVIKIKHLKYGWQVINERVIDLMRIFELKSELELKNLLNKMGYTQLVDPPEVI